MVLNAGGAPWPIESMGGQGLQVGRTYDTGDQVGASVWQRFERAQGMVASRMAAGEVGVAADGYGTPSLVAPCLGQGTFRARIIDAYERRCAVTSERTLPVLEAAHIKPYSLSGAHATENGMLLRSDLHTLFDRGCVTVTPKLELRVSRSIREEFENGRDYYALDGHEVRQPIAPYPMPSAELLEWHGDVVFRG